MKPAQLAVTLTAAALSGCLVTPTTPIEGNNSNVAQASLRASFNANGAGRPAAEVRSGHALEIGYQHTSLSSSQSLSASSPPINLNSTSFTGPAQVNNNFGLSYLDAVWRIREFGGRPFGFEILSGLGSASLDVAVDSPTQHAFQNFGSTGLELGLGLIWRSSESSSFHLRATQYFGFDKGVNDISRFDLYYANALFRNLSVHAGFSDWRVKGTGDSGMSDFEMRFSGPALMLEGAFNLAD